MPVTFNRGLMHDQGEKKPFLLMIKKGPAFSLRIAYPRTLPILIEFPAFSLERLLNEQLYGLSGAQAGHVGLRFGALSSQRFSGKRDGETFIAGLASLPPPCFCCLQMFRTEIHVPCSRGSY